VPARAAAAAPPRPVPAASRSAAPAAPARPASRPVPAEPTPETRLRLPVPPAAAAAPPAPVAPEGPRTTVAPFQAVPSPGHGDEEPASAAGVDARPTDLPQSGRRRTDARRAEEPSWRTGQPLAGGASSAPGYRDWTSPSRPEEDRPATTAIPDRNTARSGSSARRAPAPATEAIPDRTAAGRDVDVDDDRWDDERWDDGGVDARWDEADGVAAARDEPSDRDRDRDPWTDPGTGPSTAVVGGRAALRAERHAAEAARRKAGNRSTVPRLDDDEDERRPSGVRRAATGLLAVAVVALLVLGVYSFAVPDAEEASRAQSTAPTPTTSAAPASPSSALPPLEVAPLPPADGAPATPVRAPVTVLNATGITGLAREVADAIGGQGWESPGVGEYQGGDIAVTTVYYAKGDATQQQAAAQLVEQFPEIHGPAERFFEVPDTVAPGLVLVATGEWRP
ncbi:LytR C-terminal domain-containing protein, partial [Geodermatophilus sp. CPCC 206100]|uniref:LytR C-terminal domain-containing protein n=1 Tax=Geodermatophilus sp. CPCC 206100 TaxID=3020054 RepID=UPI003B0081F3